MTSTIINRTHQHKTHFYKKSFTAKYNAEYLVYYEVHNRIEDAIIREKVIKKWNRAKKEALINSMNPEWKDLWNQIIGEE